MKNWAILGTILTVLLMVIAMSPSEKAAPSKPVKVELTAEEKQKAAEEQRKREILKAGEEKQRQEFLQAEKARHDDLINNGVYIDYQIEKIRDNAYKLTAKTNLPSGMKLNVTLTNYYLLRRERGIGDEEMDITIPEHAQINREVKAIAFEKSENVTLVSGEFSAVFSGDRLKSGEYELIILSLVNSLQPATVQSAIGAHGENLFGQGVVTKSGDNQIQLEEIIYLQ
ncbi:MAG: hypothetical protein IJT73_00650 [Selenomonadaceae bacterium]|nr:hypothetical protein [Selenomonadaceae bacterium]